MLPVATTGRLAQAGPGWAVKWLGKVGLTGSTEAGWAGLGWVGIAKL